MVKLHCDRSGWTLYRDPKTGDDIDLHSDVDRDVAERLAEASHHITIAEDDSESNPEGEDDEEYFCGVNGCGRKVDSPEDTCWQHPTDES